MVDHVQTKSEIRKTLDDLGVRPRRRFGQNFLIDGNLMRRLVDCAEITDDMVVVEVGPGTGGLTDLLASRARAVIAVEIDNFLAPHLQDRFADKSHVKIIHQDILADKHHIDPDILRAIAETVGQPPSPWLLVANLPYSVATPLLINLVLLENPPARMCFTVQKEVADRIVANPGTRDFGPVSIVLQRACKITRIAELPADVFWPAPDISSSMLRLDVDRTMCTPALAADVAFIRACFLHRRKTLRFNLTKVCAPEVVNRFADSIDLARRPEALTVDEWFDLAHRAIVP